MRQRRMGRSHDSAVDRRRMDSGIDGNLPAALDREGMRFAGPTPALRRDRRPHHFRSPHHRNRHRVLPAARHPAPPRQAPIHHPRSGRNVVMNDDHDTDYDRVTAADITDFTHHLAELRFRPPRASDPAERDIPGPQGRPTRPDRRPADPHRSRLRRTPPSGPRRAHRRPGGNGAVRDVVAARRDEGITALDATVRHRSKVAAAVHPTAGDHPTRRTAVGTVRSGRAPHAPSDVVPKRDGRGQSGLLIAVPGGSGSR